MYVKTTFLFTLIASLFWLKMANTAPINWAASNLCLKAAEPVEKHLNAPSGLLQAISLKETGRWFQKQGISYPWPWTVTANGKGIYLATKKDAIRKVEELQKEGIRNIDVGCMQINLFYHPNAFSNLGLAFDPLTNTKYAAKFLTNLYENNGSWNLAIEKYHSGDAVRGQRYRRAVMALKKQVAGLKRKPPTPNLTKLAKNNSVYSQPNTNGFNSFNHQNVDFYKKRGQKNHELRKAFLKRKAKVMERWREMIQKRKTFGRSPNNRRSS